MGTPAMTARRYSVILPTFNERRNLPVAVWLIARAFTQSAIDWEVVIVDDASPDGTLQIAQQLQRVYGSDRILAQSRPGKLGLG